MGFKGLKLNIECVLRVVSFLGFIILLPLKQGVDRVQRGKFTE
ncbi:hypothetical protein BTN49_0209 [Candidatus Enterovibrio escicola]|uniref:Uncharacterized protein n=1 Tax=Candidatus Enterovibrio escicola TaxID=1927127 RepID=A0A2A5T7H4_9GAMM|nr:hypothetical protein BTN49_0209 [Candidatus Enterovibrio escacola]